jgi:adenosine kinase
MAEAEPQAKKEKSTLAVFGVGNALVDISAVVDAEFLAKWKLKPADAILNENSAHDKMFDELKARDCLYIPGGATHNTIRVANWMLDDKKCGVMAILGKDKEGEMFKAGCQKEKLEVCFYEQEKVGTGRCGVCIVEKDRSMVADLLCNDKFPAEFLFENQSFWDSADICYISGFWNTVNVEGMEKLAQECVKNEKTFITNISAPFLCQFFLENMKRSWVNTGILFGNESEAEALATALNLGDDFKTDGKFDVKKCAKEFTKLIKDGGRVIITQGGDPVVVATKGKDEIKTYDVEALPKDKIVDFNGAGDAFVGGFIAGLILKKSEADCVKYGVYGAQYIIGRSGTSFEGKPELPK